MSNDADSSPSAPYGSPAVFDPPPVVAEPIAGLSKRDALGHTSMLVAFGLFILSTVASIVLGNQEAIASLAAGATGQVTGSATLGSVIHVVLGTLVGFSVIAGGITAIAMNRGKRFGIIAIVIAVLVPIISLVTFSISLSSGLGTGSY
ncbi:MAG: hypothetical protein JWO10_679 [Microbacteriaceae bacterium]|nr:hypothetical protein [Microbacteriaceae bacterium]